jgi:hypothetical protein
MHPRVCGRCGETYWTILDPIAWTHHDDVPVTTEICTTCMVVLRRLMPGLTSFDEETRQFHSILADAGS